MFLGTTEKNTFLVGMRNVSLCIYVDFCESGDPEIVDELLRSLDAARREKWMKTAEELNFKYSSRRSWSLLRKLGASG